MPKNIGKTKCGFRIWKNMQPTDLLAMPSPVVEIQFGNPDKEETPDGYVSGQRTTSGGWCSFLWCGVLLSFSARGGLWFFPFFVRCVGDLSLSELGSGWFSRLLSVRFFWKRGWFSLIFVCRSKRLSPCPAASAFQVGWWVVSPLWSESGFLSLAVDRFPISNKGLWSPFSRHLSLSVVGLPFSEFWVILSLCVVLSSY